MSSLQLSTEITENEGKLAAHIDPAWDIWGPAGGYVAAIALRAAGFVSEDGHRPVTLSCQYIARAKHGAVQIMIEIVRPGSTACVNVRLLQDSKCFLQAQIWTTAKTIGPDVVDAKMPNVGMPEDYESTVDQFRNAGVEALPFWKVVEGRGVDFRLAGDPDPRGGRMERWLRYYDWETTQDPFLDAARSVVAIDVHVWPAHNRGLSAPAKYMAPSLDLTVWFHDQLRGEEWLLTDSISDVSREGLVHGQVRTWSRDGRLIATGGSQCLVLPFRDK